MSLKVIDGLGDPQQLKTSTDGSDKVPHQNVDTLPATFTTDTSAIKTAVQALAALISGSRLAVSLSATVESYLDGIEGLLTTLAGAITSNRMAVNVDSTTTGKLDTLHADLSPPTTYYEGNKTVVTPGTRLAIAASQVITKGAWVFAKEANVGLVYVGGASVGSNAGGRLVPGAPLWMDGSNLANIYVDAANGGDGVTYLAW